MTRTFFKTHLVHHCFSPEIYDASALLPGAPLREERFPVLTKLHKKALEQKCSCRYFVSTEEADELKEQRLAVPLIDNRGDKSFPTIHLVVTLATKTPRAATIEKAHIERAIFSDNGKYSSDLENDPESMAKREEAYRMIWIEGQIKMFKHPANDKLLSVKKISDRFGTISGRAAQKLVEVIENTVVGIKTSVWEEDLFENEPVLSFIGSDQRTSTGKAVDKESK